MLIEFSVGNFLSIKDRQTLRMDASSISEYKDQLIDAGRYQLLRSAVIYGANASGKSNVLKAMGAMRNIVTTSATQPSTAGIVVEPFLLNTETENAPGYFEVLFLLNGIRYRYGFEVDKKVVRSEWLFEARQKKEKSLFLREGDSIDVLAGFTEGKGLKSKTRDNALFLAVCDQFNGEIAKQVLKWFSRLGTISGADHQHLREDTITVLSDERYNKQLENFLGKLGLGFEEVIIGEEIVRSQHEQTEDLSHSPATTFIKTDLLAVHLKYDPSGKIAGRELFNLDYRESAGTQKLFDILGPIFLSLLFGGVQIVDELDAKLHPLMTQAIIRLFNDPTLNPNNAQLIFATHDTNLLTYGGFRRDQIYFTEKDQYGATCLYSLIEYQEENGDKVRKDRSYEKDYIQGRYGAIPFIGDLSKLAPAWHEK